MDILLFGSANCDVYSLNRCVNLQVAGGRIQDRDGGREEEEGDGKGFQPAG